MKLAVITGACGGLGKAFSRLCAEKNYHLLLTGTNKERLEILKTELIQKYAVEVQIRVCDLSDPEETASFCEELEQLKINLLINNAGIGQYGTFESMDMNLLIKMNQINMTSLMMLTHAVLPGMKRNGGGILNVASTASFQPGPMMANYYASKSYVLSLTEAIALEMKGTSVNVCALCCGPLETDFSKKANLKHTWTQKCLMIDPYHAAKIGLSSLERGKVRVIAGVMNRFLIAGSRFVPHALLLNLMQTVQSKRQG